MLAQFNNLIQEVASGQMHRNVFEPWELELLLDIESCCVRQSSRASLLRRYQRAATTQASAGGAPILRFSDFLADQRKRRNRGKASVAVAAAGYPQNREQGN
jgi:hypothetical protein